MEYYSAIKDETLPLTTTWMDLEIIMRNEVRKGQEPYDFTQIWDVKQIAKKVIDTDKTVVDTRGVGAWVKDEESEWGQYVVTKQD